MFPQTILLFLVKMFWDDHREQPLLFLHSIRAKIKKVGIISAPGASRRVPLESTSLQPQKRKACMSCDLTFAERN
jgi:hypothetical protein